MRPTFATILTVLALLTSCLSTAHATGTTIASGSVQAPFPAAYPSPDLVSYVGAGCAQDKKDATFEATFNFRNYLGRTLTVHFRSTDTDKIDNPNAIGIEVATFPSCTPAPDASTKEWSLLPAFKGAAAPTRDFSLKLDEPYVVIGQSSTTSVGVHFTIQVG